ncbi:pyridoxine 5'-phosphate synthase [Pelomonas sp. SE-A7]|uniref:pyridoxine 5'-phosphate synthase n=1 Tax=Pelomonas sp. SE-A7 TaxID=3054953 RepID=UPI00259C80E2|nr:pyridoxine 5'-phosphate synthase [Pelomonas sp. SE-A7]MDM4767482.1 pyridoxine 5'-phosphate synthase [Pelomonas sp. SE-A7]
MNPLVMPDGAQGGRCALSVNVNKVALLRNTRHLGIPSVLKAAEACLLAGAQGITVHPRPDARHIRSSDVNELAELLKAWPHAEYNIEGNPTQNLMDFVREIRPHQVTFVPDSEDQFTSDHGWNLPADMDRLRPLIAECKQLGVRVSLFMDPLPEAMVHVAALGAERIELYTETYASTFGTPREAEVVAGFAATARAALAQGLGINAGHDLNRENLTRFLQEVPGVQEVSIGHALVADALELGYAETVREYQRSIQRAYIL